MLTSVLIMFVLCFLQRLSLVWRNPLVFDSWGHLFFLTAVRDQKTGPFKPINVNVVSGGPFNYPLLSHWLLSRVFPACIPLNWIKAANPIIEAVCLALYMIIAYSAGLSVEVVTSTAILYVFTPMIFSKVSIGPNGLFTTRLYSELATGILMMLAYLPVPLSSFILTSIMAVLVAYVLLSSKFGLQVLVLLVLPSSILTGNFSLALALIFGTCLALLVTKGQAWNVWLEQWRHLEWYFREAKQKNAPIVDRNSVNTFRRAFENKSRKKQMIELMFALAARNSFTALIVKFPVAVFTMLVFLFVQHDHLLQNGNFGPVLLIAAVIFVLVNTTIMIIVGEAERYINHIAFLVLLNFSYWAIASENPYLIYFFLGLGVAYWIAEILLLGLFKLGQKQLDEDGAMEFLKSNYPEPITVLSWPHHVLSPWRIMVESKHQPIFPIAATGDRAAFLKSIEKYPYIDLSKVEDLRREFGLQCIILEEADTYEEDIARLLAEGWQKYEGSSLSGISIYAFNMGHP